MQNVNMSFKNFYEPLSLLSAKELLCAAVVTILQGCFAALCSRYDEKEKKKGKKKILLKFFLYQIWSQLLFLEKTYYRIFFPHFLFFWFVVRFFKIVMDDKTPEIGLLPLGAYQKKVRVFLFHQFSVKRQILILPHNTARSVHTATHPLTLSLLRSSSFF